MQSVAVDQETFQTILAHLRCIGHRINRVVVSGSDIQRIANGVVRQTSGANFQSRAELFILTLGVVLARFLRSPPPIALTFPPKR